jgi:hypothetical protein
MIHYNGDLLLAPMPRERFLWRVVHSVTCLWTRDVESETIFIAVPEDFITDFASVPRLFWTLFPPHDGQYRLPAIFHDRLYENHQMLRFQADQFFYEAMEHGGVSRRKRALMYYAVRTCGEAAYNSGPQRQHTRVDVLKRLRGVYYGL